MVVNESEALRWVTKQWQMLNGKDEILGVGGRCGMNKTKRAMFHRISSLTPSPSLPLKSSWRIFRSKNVSARNHRNYDGGTVLVS